MSGHNYVHEIYKWVVHPRGYAIEMQVDTSSAKLDIPFGRGVAGSDDYDKATQLCFEALKQCAPEGLAARELVQKLAGMDKEVHLTPIKLNRLISSFLERFHPQGGTPAELEKFPIVRHSSEDTPKRYIYHYVQPQTSSSDDEQSELSEAEPESPPQKRKTVAKPSTQQAKRQKVEPTAEPKLLPMSMEEFLSFDKQMVMDELEKELALF